MRRYAIFLGIVTVILYITNLVVYEALATALVITGSLSLLLLGAGLGLLSAGFVGAMLLGSKYYNWFTRTYYTLLAIWMGTLGNLFFASLALGIIGLFPLIGIAIPVQSTGMALFAGALLVSIYGVVHAKNVTSTHYTVPLKGLPEAWKNKKAVWISDLHLGHIHGPKFARKVTETVMAHNPEMIFIGGDLYDGTTAPDLYKLAEPLKNLSAPWGVYYITGNHEEYGDMNAFLEAVRRLGITILRDEKIEVEGVQLLGVDYRNASSAEGFAKILDALQLSAEKPSILLKHEPRDLHIAHAAGVSVQISGHTHYGQQWPFRYMAQLAYKGYAYGLNPFKGMHMLTSSGIGTWGPPLRVGTKGEAVVITFV